MVLFKSSGYLVFHVPLCVSQLENQMNTARIRWWPPWPPETSSMGLAPLWLWQNILINVVVRLPANRSCHRPDLGPQPPANASVELPAPSTNRAMMKTIGQSLWLVFIFSCFSFAPLFFLSFFLSASVGSSFLPGLLGAWV